MRIKVRTGPVLCDYKCLPDFVELPDVGDLVKVCQGNLKVHKRFFRYETGNKCKITLELDDLS